MKPIPQTGIWRTWAAVGCALLSLCAAACSHAKRYDLKGTVISVDADQKQLTIKSEAIPGFMIAMIMPYSVKDAKELTGLEAGDRIAGQLIVDGGNAWLEKIIIISKGPPQTPPITGEMHIPAAGEEPPNFQLVNQDDKPLHLRDYLGRSVLLTFIYTKCPMPTYCPRMSDNFKRIEQALVKDPAAYSKTHLLSVSFDPKNDTPAVLRAYGKRYLPQNDEGAFRHWEFASAPPDEMKGIAGFFGVFYKPDEDDEAVIVHSLGTAVLSPDGKIYKWYHGNDWKPEDVLQDLEASLGNGAGTPAASK